MKNCTERSSIKSKRVFNSAVDREHPGTETFVILILKFNSDVALLFDVIHDSIK